MKWFKRILICILIIIFLFFAFYKPKRINLEGNWKTKEIVLNGKKIYPDTLSNFIDFGPEIIINGWTKSISIPIYRNNLPVSIQYSEKIKEHYTVKLFSNEKSLNGNFDLIIDTLDTGPQSYIVDVKLKSNKTLIHFQKQVIIPPWKPEFPKRGQV
ncbi:hypothetical protein [Flavobacterium aestivum]|uniref:hypothetical protein n=1 Tax=Flavobacterium aestivum TaxID=3003257 RepID=UPI002285BEF2|nr:hypothetical protein [Flavobacterium aestivum]